MSQTTSFDPFATVTEECETTLRDDLMPCEMCGVLIDDTHDSECDACRIRREVREAYEESLDDAQSELDEIDEELYGMRGELAELLDRISQAEKARRAVLKRLALLQA